MLLQGLCWQGHSTRQWEAEPSERRRFRLFAAHVVVVHVAVVVVVLEPGNQLDGVFRFVGGLTFRLSRRRKFKRRRQWRVVALFDALKLDRLKLLDRRETRFVDGRLSKGRHRIATFVDVVATVVDAQASGQNSSNRFNWRIGQWIVGSTEKNS